MRRVLLALVGVVSAVSVLSVGLATPAGAADAGAEAEFVDRINGARSGAGKGRLATDAELTTIARRWSQRMANDQRLSHNPNLANEVQADWEKLAENVGFGQNVAQIHEAFMNSTAHRNNILDGAFTHVGVGVVIDGSGQMWVTQVFMRLRGGGGGGGSAPPPTTAAPPPPPPPPPTTTTARPAPAPTSPPTTRAPRLTAPTTARPAPTPTAPPVTEAPDPAAAAAATAAAAAAAEAAAAGAGAASRTPTARLVLVLNGLRALDQGR